MSAVTDGMKKKLYMKINQLLPLIYGFFLLSCSVHETSNEQRNELSNLQLKNDSLQHQLDSLTLVLRTGNDSLLVGTTFLPYSNKMIGLLNKGLEPISLEIIENCDDSWDHESDKDYPKFIASNRTATTLSIDVTIIANCCHNFLGEAEIMGDTLNLMYTSYGGFCGCECPFTLRYTFDTTLETEYQVLRFVTINKNSVVGVLPEIR
jgi:hypothetical protein